MSNNDRDETSEDDPWPSHVSRTWADSEDEGDDEDEDEDEDACGHPYSYEGASPPFESKSLWVAVLFAAILFFCYVLGAFLLDH